MSRLFYNSTVHEQAVLFMTMLDTVIGLLDNENELNARLEELGRVHTLAFGVKTKHYKHFKTAFMKAIRIYIPWNNHRENAWQWFWNRVISVMSIYENNNNVVSPFNLTQDQYTEYVSAIRESFDNAIEQSPLDLIKQFHDLLLNEQPTIANLFLPSSENNNYYAQLLAILQYTIRLLDDQQEFKKQIISLILRYRNYGINENQLGIVIEAFIRILRQSNDHKWKPIYDDAWQWMSQSVIRLFVTSRNLNVTYNSGHYM